MKLYEIKNDLREVLDLVSNEESGELYTDTLESLQLEFEDKAEGVALYIKELNAEAEAIKAEENVLSERRKAKENKAEKLKQYLSNNMMEVGVKKIDTSKVALSFRKSTAVSITNEKDIPEAYTEIVKTAKIDKKAIGDAIKSGQVVPGAELVENMNLQIK